LRIEVKDVSMTYQAPEGEVEALNGVSFDVEDGAFVSIVGPSGCGKSTLLSLLAGLERPTAGRILFDGAPLDPASRRIGLMPQRDQLFEWRTILRNVLLGPEIQGNNTPLCRRNAERLLEQYALSGFADKPPSRLSGGMRQRCALIRTLAIEPEVLLLDEPFSALDYQTRLAVSADISEIIRRTKKTALLVTHDIAEAISMSDQIVVLSRRPGHVRSIHALTQLQGLGALQRRESGMFQSLFHQIWEELNEDAGG